ncbi:MAG: hypothetical protein H0T44_09045 [Gemmatimonadales bacterium]|nr:hypothetical protein [Gemmatimonadales bacterium]
MSRLALVLSLLLASRALAQSPARDEAPPPRTGEELIQQMRQRYDGKWYRTLTFVQKTTLPDGKIEIWYEALSAPGRLRIDVAPLDSMNTLIFSNDSLYEFQRGKLARATAQVHPLLVLGFDVYVQPAGVTVQKLRSLDFDLGKIHDTVWQGRPTYVVGAEAGDSVSRQFWIDKERLYFVRSLEPAKQNASMVLDIRFQKYRPMGGGWLEMEVLFLAGGEQRMKEEHTRPAVDVRLDPTIFNPEQWTPPTWLR